MTFIKGILHAICILKKNLPIREKLVDGSLNELFIIICGNGDDDEAKYSVN